MIGMIIGISAGVLAVIIVLALLMQRIIRVSPDEAIFIVGRGSVIEVGSTERSITSLAEETVDTGLGADA